jgi:hypothetical protein
MIARRKAHGVTNGGSRSSNTLYEGIEKKGINAGGESRGFLEAIKLYTEKHHQKTIILKNVSGASWHSIGDTAVPQN